MSFTQTLSAKESIKNYWDNCAAKYDRQFGHGIGSATEKTIWLDLLKTNIGKKGRLKVLDVGCGTGFLSLLLCEMGHDVTGIDFSSTMRAEARRKAKMQGAKIVLLAHDAEAPSFSENSFDVVISRHLIWTLTNPSKALENWKRLLNTGGRVVIIDGVWTPRDFLSKVRYFLKDLIRFFTNSPHHLNWQSTYVEDLSTLPFFGGAEPEKIISLLKSKGFKNIVHDPMEAVLSYERRHGPLEYRLSYTQNRRYLISGQKEQNA